MAQGTIYIENTDNHDLYVTINDRNAFGNPAIWTNEPLNEDETKGIICEIDGDGEAHLDWSAVERTDPEVKSSGRETVNEGERLSVYADG